MKFSHIKIHLNARQWTLLASFLLPFFIMLGYFISRQMAPFGQSSILTVDLGQQYVDFFAYLRRAILHHPSSFFYSLGKGLGGEMWGTNAYYLWSPLNLLLLPFTGQHLASGILFLTLAKYGCAGLSMAWLLERQNLQHNVRTVAFATAYALMGWIIANQLNLLWLDVLFILPPLLAGLIDIWQGKRPWLYVGWLTIALVDNYYMAWMCCVFTILFSIWQISGQQLSWKTLGWRFLKYAGSSLLAVGNAMVVLLPTLFTLLDSKATYTSNSWQWKLEYRPWKMLAKLLVPGTFNFKQMPSGQPNLYVGVLIVCAALAYLLSRHIAWQRRLAAIIITAFLAASFCVQALDLFWHIGQFPVWYPYRFSFIASFWLIWLAAQVIQPGFRLSWWQTTVIALLIGSGLIWLWFHSSQLSYISHDQILMAAAFLAASLIYFNLPSTENPLAVDLLLLLLIGLDVGTNAVISLNNISYVPKNQFAVYTRTMDQAVSRLQKHDHGLYRTGKTFMRTKDDPFQAGFNSGDHFGSTLKPNTPNFMGAIGQPDGDGFVTYSNGTQVTDSLLGFKYFMSARHSGYENGQNVLPITSYRPDLKGQHCFAMTKMVWLSHNKNALPLAFGANKEIVSLKRTTMDPVQYQSQLFQALAGRPIYQSLFAVQDFDHVTFNNVQRSTRITGTIFRKQNLLKPASITLTIVPHTNGSYYLTLGPELKDNATIKINGKPLPQYPTYRNTVVSNIAYHDRGRHINVTIGLKHSSLWMQDVSLYRLHQGAFQSSLRTLQRSPITIKHYSSTTIKGLVNTKANQQVLMTTIPNDEGWHVKVDGKAVAPQTVAGLFMAIPMTPGHHQITLHYRPPYLITGLLVSILSLVVSGLLAHYLPRRQLI
ncbi:YfhO family protein [Limosilactobacillus sp.]|uniref:YfhO family protein n=1 Tax=Limosilactobacillus sp. TaxID=2773925 RepID=UPI00345F0F8D